MGWDAISSLCCSASPASRFENQLARRRPRRLGVIESQKMIFPLEPGFELVVVMRTSRVSRLALGINRPQAGGRGAQIGNQAVAGAGAGFEVWARTGVAHGVAIARDRQAAVIEELSQVAAA